MALVKKFNYILFLFLALAASVAAWMAFRDLAGGWKIAPARADAGDNLSGYAWSSNFGWVSFNCTNDTPACSGTNYGVNFNQADGHFSGYAWSSNLGWISFNETGAPDYDFNANCLTAGSCDQAHNCTACYNFSDHKVYGWAKALSLGAAGWIKFTGDWTNGVTVNPETGDFSGWAWNADSDSHGGLGWVSFNCANESPACSGTNYKVTLGGASLVLPEVSDLTAPNWNYAQAAGTALRANLQFGLIDSDPGSYGSAYQLIIKKADDTPVLDTGKCTGYLNPSADCLIDNDVCLKNGSTGCLEAGDCACQYALDSAKLNYNTSYKWWVKIWDNTDLASALTAYDTTPDTDNDDGVVPTFTTYKHKFPKVSATYVPASPGVGEEVKFTDTSKTFLTAAPEVEVPCTPALCSYVWTVPADATIDDLASSTPTVIFNGAGTKSVTLKVTDLIDGYYASAAIPVGVTADLPLWKEVKPE